MFARFFLFFLMLCGSTYAGFRLTWSAPGVGLDSNPSIGDTDLNVSSAMDQEGNAVAVWGRTAGQGSIEEVWAAIYHHQARVWVSAWKISGPTNAMHPTVTVDGEGNALFFWQEGFPSQIVYRTLSRQGIWKPSLDEPPTPLFFSVNEQTSPKLAVSGERNVLVFWEEFEEGQYHIYGGRLHKGILTERFGRISSGDKDAELISVRPLAASLQGHAALGWREKEPSGQYSLWAAIYQHGLWFPPRKISEEASHYTVAISDDKEAVISWSSLGRVYARHFTKDALLDTKLLSDPRFFAQKPYVGMDKRGDAAVVFERMDTPVAGSASFRFISSATFSKSSASWSSAQDISAPSFEPSPIRGAGYPILSLNGIGDGVAIWKEYDGEHLLIRGAGYSLGTWSLFQTLSSETVNAGSLQEEYDLALSSNEAGTIVAIWPEDTNGMKTPQMKTAFAVGLAAKTPQPPTIALQPGIGVAYGRQEKHVFPLHMNLFNVLTWSPPAGGAAGYRIYRGNLNHLIQTVRTTYFEDHRRLPNKTDTYLITAIDENGIESVPITVLVEPHIARKK